MKNLMIVLIACATTIATAQNTIEWVGGTPGFETTWNEPRNWSSNTVPDEMSYVVIGDQIANNQSHPILDELVHVVSIEVYEGAVLTVTENGHLVIDGTESFSQGMMIFGENIHNTGEISLNRIDSKFVINDSTVTGVDVIVYDQPLITAFY